MSRIEALFSSTKPIVVSYNPDEAALYDELMILPDAFVKPHVPSLNRSHSGVAKETLSMATILPTLDLRTSYEQWQEGDISDNEFFNIITGEMYEHDAAKQEAAYQYDQVRSQLEHILSLLEVASLVTASSGSIKTVLQCGATPTRTSSRPSAAM
jgi:hypothetical protein